MFHASAFVEAGRLLKPIPMKKKKNPAPKNEIQTGEELVQSIYADMKSKGLIDELTNDGETHIIIQTSEGTFMGEVNEENLEDESSIDTQVQ